MKNRIERKFAKQAPGQKAGEKHTFNCQQPKISKRHGNIFANSPASKEFSKMHAGIFSGARKLIQEKLCLILQGKIVVDKECTVAVQKAGTGKYHGKERTVTMKVTTEGKEFFVKIASPDRIKRNILALAQADDFLGKRGYKYGTFNVRAILPHKAVTYKGISYLATDFFNAGDVEQVSEMKNAGEITKCIRGLDKELSKIRVYDTLPVNAFYHQKTNTILLFDLVA